MREAFSVDDWLIEPQLNEARRGGERVRLEPRSMEVLVALAQKPGEVLSKASLLAAVWGESFVTEEVLTHAVWELRKAFGDSARRPRYIQTIPKRGYRLIAPIREARAAPERESPSTVPDAPSKSDVGPAAPAGRRLRGRRLWWPALLLAVAVLGVGVVGGLRPHPSGSATRAQRIMVRPFESRILEGRGTSKQEHFVAGITEEITRRIAALDSLDVASRDTAARYARRPVSEVRDELGVDYILDGTVNWTRADDGKDRIRITPRLQYAAEDREQWLGPYDRVIRDILRLYSEVSQRIVDELNVELLLPDARLEAYRAYLEGLEVRNRSIDDSEALKNAVDLFRDATEIDDTLVAAWAELAKTHALVYFNDDSSEKRLRSAVEALGRAQRLAAKAPEVRLAEGVVAYYVDKDFVRALELVEGVAAELPENAEVLELLGYLHRRFGRLDRAVELLEAAFELDPQNASLCAHLAETLRAQRRFDEAASFYHQARILARSRPVIWGEAALNLFAETGSFEQAAALLSQYPHAKDARILFYRFPVNLFGRRYEAARRDYLWFSETPTFHQPVHRFQNSWYTALALERLGRRDDARLLVDEIRSFLEEQVHRAPGFYFYQAYLALTYAYLGRESDAKSEIESALEMVRGDAFSGPRIRELQARILLLTGDLDRAFELLTELVATDYQHSLTRAELRADPFWDPWRSDPRFQELAADRDDDVEPSARSPVN